jgi:hypothetical protein
MHKIAIHSVPRSGSTWLGEILNSSINVKYCFQPLFSYKFKGFLDERSPKEDIDNFFSMLNDTDDEFICQNSQRAVGTLPNFEKLSFTTHVIYKEVRYHHILENLISEDNEIKLVLLIRNPIEVMNSWINAPKEFDKSWNLDKELLNAGHKNQGRKENFYGLNAWIQTTKLFERLAKNHSQRVVLINYSSLQNNLIQTVRDLFGFCNLELTNSTNSFLNESIEKKVSDTYSVFRGGKQSQITLNDKLIEKIIKHVSDAELSHYIDL